MYEVMMNTLQLLPTLGNGFPRITRIHIVYCVLHNHVFETLNYAVMFGCLARDTICLTNMTFEQQTAHNLIDDLFANSDL